MIILTKSREHIKPVLSSLHWLPVKERIDFKIACFIFKCLHHLAPTYLSEIIHLYVPARSLRSANECRLVLPAYQLSISERAFSIGGPKLWNSLSLNTRLSNDLAPFKKSLKTELFKRAYQWMYYFVAFYSSDAVHVIVFDVLSSALEHPVDLGAI